jgi:hypothetical protein
MQRLLISCLVLGFFCFSPSYGGGGDLSDVRTFVQHYRDAPLEDSQLRHLAPLTPEAKDAILTPLQTVLLEMNPQEHSQPELFHLLQEVSASKENPTTSGLDVLRYYLKLSSSLGPWTEGDRTLSLLFRAVEKMRALAFDSQLSPQTIVEGTVQLMLEEKNSGIQKLLSRAGVLFYPVVGKKFFKPVFLTECFIHNVFPVAVSTQPENHTHGFPTSSLGHALHDISHGLVVINTKREKFKKDLDKICTGLPFDGMIFEACEAFQNQALDFLFSKNKIYEEALLETLHCLEGQGERLPLAGLFFAVHEAGINAWPHPLSMSPDFGHVTEGFLRGAVEAFQKYYNDPWGTSPKDGTPPALDRLPESIVDVRIPQGAVTQFIPHGVVLEVRWAQNSERRVGFFTTQNWSLQEAKAAQWMLAWGFGEESHEFHLPVPADSEDDGAFREYIATALRDPCITGSFFAMMSKNWKGRHGRCPF